MQNKVRKKWYSGVFRPLDIPYTAWKPRKKHRQTIAKSLAQGGQQIWQHRSAETGMKCGFSCCDTFNIL